MEPREIRVGDRVLRLEPFKGSKAVRALKLVSSIAKQSQPTLVEWGMYDQNYRETHTMTYTRQLAEVRVAQSEDEDVKAAWQRIIDGPLKNRESVSIPQSPSQDQKMAAFFPAFFDAAEDDVVRLLALVLIPNEELKAAREAGDVDGALRKLGDDLLDSLDLDELAIVALDAAQLLSDQLKGSGERLGKLRALVSGTVDPAAQAAVEEANPDTRKTEPTVGTVVETTASGTNGSSSTDSPTPTDGELSESSSESRGATSQPSAV